VPVAGAIEYSTEKAEPATLALLQAYVPNQGDGWSYTLDYLERYMEGRRSITDPLKEEPPPKEVHGAYLALMQTLAVRTAELHRALAAGTDPAFRPEPLLPEDVAAWKARVVAEAQETLALIEKRAIDRPEKGQLLKQRQRLLERIERCAAPAGPAVKIRHHGDYHLGQVLLASNDFLIIDFEGEPSRPLSQSRLKHSPLRDVAGMLRSFNYAKWSALMRAAEADPAFDRMLASMGAWEAVVRKTFLDSYARAAAGSGLFSAFGDVRGLLALFEIEKVLYELRYELNNRPTWVHIPLQGLLALLEG
jgi:maltose alpha-D-glucosyltransferase/alpha-amylase